MIGFGKVKKVGILVMADEATRYMAAPTISKEQSITLQKVIERS